MIYRAYRDRSLLKQNFIAASVLGLTTQSAYWRNRRKGGHFPKQKGKFSFDISQLLTPLQHFTRSPNPTSTIHPNSKPTSFPNFHLTNTRTYSYLLIVYLLKSPLVRPANLRTSPFPSTSKPTLRTSVRPTNSRTSCKTFC